MITTEQQQQIDSVMELLSTYITQAPWEEWMVEVFSEAVAYAAEMLELSEEEVLDYLDEQPLGQMAHAHVFEHFITTETNESDETVLHEFIRTRIENEPFMLAYLNALDASELALWEVVGFKAGQYADVRRFGTTDASIRVPVEASSIPKNICIAARLLSLPGDVYTFGFGLLPIERNEAEDILAYLEQVRSEMLETAQTDAIEHEQADVEAAIQEELRDVLFHETFASWIAQGFEE